MLLTGLPVEIIKLIAEHIIDTGSRLAPNYQDDRWEIGKVNAKRKHYYGDGFDIDEDWAITLVNLGSACRQIRTLIAPQVYRHLVLRPRRKSVMSLQALSEQPYWQHVESLVFAGAHKSNTEKALEVEMGKAKITNAQRLELQQRLDICLGGFEVILSNLPPSLKSLTLDLFQDWGGDELIFNNMLELNTHMDDDSDNDTSDEELGAAEDCNRYRMLLRNTFEALLQNDISEKNSFELKLYNIPPYPCSIWDHGRFAPFLKYVTSVTLGLRHYNSRLRTMDTRASCPWTKRLGKLFFNHLENVESFVLDCDPTWPLGLYSQTHILDLPLPDSSDRMPKVSHVTFRHTLICQKLTDFICSHAATLQSMTLENCRANRRSSSPPWIDFFNAIANANPSRLTSFQVYYTKTDKKGMLKVTDLSTTEERTSAIHEVLAFEKTMQVAARQAGWSEAAVKRRTKQLYRYYEFDGSLGGLKDTVDLDVREFLYGKAHDAYMRVVMITEVNLERERNLR